jgi:hypothetical protein
MGTMMSKKKKDLLKRQIYRTVASSTAIETGESIQAIEKKLQNKNSKFKWLTLA